ncbi:MAG: hypothetical protein AB8B63_11070 [Granulosicoccus sp.]
MNDLRYQLGNIFSQHPELKWMIVIIGILLLSIALYKLFVVHTVASNGLVSTRIHLPKIKVRKPQLHIQSKRKPLSPQQRVIMSFLYRGQQLIFGSLVFVFGLALCTLAYYWLVDILPTPGNAWITIAAICGIAALPVGFLIAYYRDRNNPFKGSTAKPGSGG